RFMDTSNRPRRLARRIRTVRMDALVVRRERLDRRSRAPSEQLLARYAATSATALTALARALASLISLRDLRGLGVPRHHHDARGRHARVVGAQRCRRARPLARPASVAVIGMNH